MKAVLREIRRAIFARKDSAQDLPQTPFLPRKVYPDDVFVVSYPRSGNTWVRFLIANLVKQDTDEIVDFYSSVKYIPEVGRHNSIIESLCRPRLMKSHAPYQSGYPNVVYIVRDGRDVYVSFYHHRLHALPSNTTFGEFLARTDHWPCLWCEHVDSWLLAREKPRMVVIRYEDLLADTEREILKIASFLGLEPTMEQIRYAIEQSSFENMRRLEVERGRPYKAESPGLFVRRGRPGNWKEYFGEEEKEIFKKRREGSTLVRLGYESDDNW